jgi:hypothetical protein
MVDTIHARDQHDIVDLNSDVATCLSEGKCLMRGPRGKNEHRANRHLRLETLERRAMLHGGSLSGFVYLDADADGTRDVNEGGVPGVVIRLTENNPSEGSVDQSTITDLNGAYLFDDLDPGTYRLAKRSNPALVDGQESTSAPGAESSNDVLTNVELGDEQTLSDNNFAALGLRPEYINIAWFFASSPPAQELLRETIAKSEELAGNTMLAESIRAGGNDVPTEANASPVASNDAFSVRENEVLTITATSGVLANDVDANGDVMTAILVEQASNGLVTLSSDGSFTYTPSADFTGIDSFNYRANDAASTSNVATVTIQVNPIDETETENEPFGPVTPGAFDDPGLLGTRTDLVAGAPAITAPHVSTAVIYDGYSNPPTYGPHHGFVEDAQNHSITPRATGVYSTAQPDEDLVHNLEHGHVWISYNPDLVSSADQSALEQLVEDGGTNSGVILTPRSQNTAAIALASWALLQTLDSFDATAIRNFVETNRGHAPEGFIPSGQKEATAASESLDDGFLHTHVPNALFEPVIPGSADDPGLLGTRMDTQAGAPPLSLEHVTTAVDFSAFENAPSYGQHHAVVRDAENNFITPRPTGVYGTEQPDEDLVHNVEHGHVWISYNPSLISNTDLEALEQLVIDGGTNTGVIVTPRAKNTAPIVLTSFARQMTLSSFNATTIRAFINTNRGHSPEGFIPSGQKPANGDSLDDGLPHSS